MLTDKHVDQFQALYRARYKKEINRAEAYEELVALVRFVELVSSSTVEIPDASSSQKDELDNRQGSVILN